MVWLVHSWDNPLFEYDGKPKYELDLSGSKMVKGLEPVDGEYA